MTTDVLERPKGRANKLGPQRLQPGQNYFRVYDVAAEAGTEFDDILRPEWWANVSAKLGPMSLVNVISDDCTFYALVLVLSAGTGFARVKVLLHEDLETQSVDAAPVGYTVKWNGPHDKFAVIRDSDKVKLKDGFSAKVDAERWMREHRVALAR